MLSLFHGLTDFKGMWAFLNDIIYRYAVNTGFDVPDIRICGDPAGNQDRFDPYSLYFDDSADFTLPEIRHETFFISLKNTLKVFTVSMNTR